MNGATSTCLVCINHKSSIEHNIELLVILFYLKSTCLLLSATAYDMVAKTEKSKVLHYFNACLNVLTTKNNQLQALQA